MAGIDLKTVQDLMGHRTIAMTARYDYLSPGHLKSAITKLDAKPEALRSRKWYPTGTRNGPSMRGHFALVRKKEQWVPKMVPWHF
jgi:hypothetical protein